MLPGCAAAASGKGDSDGGHQPRRRAARRVSQPTVSRALRDSPKVSEETKQRVRKAARALGYVPSETGRALSSGRTRRIGLLLTDLENQFYPHVIAPMHRELERAGLPAGAADRVLRHRPGGRAAARQRPRRRAAGHHHGRLGAAGAAARPRRPLRLLQPHAPTRSRPTRPTVDAESGHGRAGPARSSSSATAGSARSSARATPAPAEQRETALREALGRARAHHPAADCSYRGPFDFETGYDGRAPAAAAQTRRPTVIVCGNDVVALGALNAARELGVDVPGEVSDRRLRRPARRPLAAGPADHGGLRPRRHGPAGREPAGRADRGSGPDAVRARASSPPAGARAAPWRPRPDPRPAADRLASR